MKSIARSLLALTILLAGLAAAQTKITSVEGITEYRLDNGLDVLLFPDKSKPTVTVNVTYLVGSRMRATAKPAWRICWSTCCSRARRKLNDIAELLNESRRQLSTGRPITTAPIISRPCRRPTTICTGRWKWKPTAWSTRGFRAHGSGQRNDRGPQRIRERREQSRAHSGRARAVDRVPVARLRPQPHRVAERHRKGTDRKLAGVLSQLLSAR